MVAIACGDRRDYQIHVLVPQNQWLTPLPVPSPWWSPSMLDDAPYLPPTPPETKPLTMGWTCPKCGKVYSPATNECGGCNGAYTFTVGPNQ
jgi:hypothetical protein